MGCISFYAEGNERGCISYQRADGSWSHGYKVNGIIASGNDLNRATNSYKYSGFYNYFVVRFKNGGYVALQISFGSSLPYIEQQTLDQSGNIWKMSKGWNMCL